MAKRILSFVKKEIVFVAAWVLAIVSAFFVPPDATYLTYIDLRTLCILWSLMVIVAGLKSGGVFDFIGHALLKKTHNISALIFVLVFLCFFLSMFITNDVALITFVPFAIFVLKECEKEELLILVIVLQTLAANLGSILTPIGNPQNLYLYSLSGMRFLDMCKLMLPYTVLSAAMLVVSVFLIKGKSKKASRLSLKLSTEQVSDLAAKQMPDLNAKQVQSQNLLGYKNILFFALFVVAILAVLRLFEYWWLAAAVLIVTLIIDRKRLLSADYILLFTFIGFFIFTGNIARLPVLQTVLTNIVGGHEVLSGVISSQVISNVPAALLLSGFTTTYNALIIGVNLGGLGTPIASMASLISLKFYSESYPNKKLSYLKIFTLLNVLYLAVLLIFYFLLGKSF